MSSFILKKIWNGILVMIGVITVVFIIFQAYGDPARMMLGQSGDQKTIENIRTELNLDKPLWQQYMFYLNDLSPIAVHDKNEIEQKNLHGLFIGNQKFLAFKLPYLRRSYQTKKEVSTVLLEALPGTLILACTAMGFAIVFGIALGIIAAIKQNTWMDTSAVAASVVGISAPSFFMAIVISYVFGLLLHDYTGLTLTGSWFDLDPITGEKYLTLKNLILPAITLGIRPLAIITQLTRSSMLEVLSQDYIRTAYAKGLSKTKVLLNHALRNALNPVLTAITGWFAELLAGSFFVEYIFGWNGIGKVTVDALEKLDYPVVMGSVLFGAFVFVFINIVADFLYGIIDPRVRS